MGIVHEAFERIYVCRFFRVSGFMEILRRFPLDTKRELNLWFLQDLLGNLSNEGFIEPFYLVNRKKVINFENELNTSLGKCKLHNAWCEICLREHKTSFNIENLAELLFHEVTYYKKCSNNFNHDSVSYLEDKTEEYLDPKLEELTPKENNKFISDLVEWIESHKIFNNILSNSENKEYIDFLNSKLV